MVDADRFGNRFAPNLSYARGDILPTTADDVKKLQHAWAFIRERGAENIYIFTGLEHHMPMQPEDLAFADDEIGPALHFDRLKELALEHLGGTPDKHDVAVFNRLTGATMATHLTLVRPGDRVIGVSASHSHPSVLRAADHTGARFTDTAGLAAFKDVIAGEKEVKLVVLTRLAVTYDLLPLDAITQIVRIAHDKGALVYVDDAGGARVGPAAFDQPRTLELGVDVGATGLDKYGTIGPRFGLLAGRQDLVDKIRAKGFEFGMEARQALYPAVVHTLEQYDPRRIQVLIDSTKTIAAEMRPLFGNRLRETPTTVQLAADDILDIAMERGGIDKTTVVPYEAKAALCMLMLKDYDMLMVHFVGVPPGGADLLIKFVPPETLKKFGGPKKYAEAVNNCLTKVGRMLQDPESIRRLLLGGDTVH
jgi:L-seryl-tRNA(Ser) seleniumtransferase